MTILLNKGLKYPILEIIYFKEVLMTQLEVLETIKYASDNNTERLDLAGKDINELPLE